MSKPTFALRRYDEQHLFQLLCPVLKSWGHPCSWPTPGCLWPWAWPRWSWMSGKTLNQPSFTCWTTFASTTFPKNWFLGMSGLRSSRNLSAPPTLIRAGNLECSGRFWTLGVKPDPMVPHTWGFGSSPTIPQGGVVVGIYIRIRMWKCPGDLA